jgi:hypothetical protein
MRSPFDALMKIAGRPDWRPQRQRVGTTSFRFYVNWVLSDSRLRTSHKRRMAAAAYDA